MLAGVARLVDGKGVVRTLSRTLDIILWSRLLGVAARDTLLRATYPSLCVANEGVVVLDRVRAGGGADFVRRGGFLPVPDDV